jgi:hypothetical protein
VAVEASLDGFAVLVRCDQPLDGHPESLLDQQLSQPFL